MAEKSASVNDISNCNIVIYLLICWIFITSKILWQNTVASVKKWLKMRLYEIIWKNLSIFGLFYRLLDGQELTNNRQNIWKSVSLIGSWRKILKNNRTRSSNLSKNCGCVNLLGLFGLNDIWDDGSDDNLISHDVETLPSGMTRCMTSDVYD
jgi:hypothetical protein